MSSQHPSIQVYCNRDVMSMMTAPPAGLLSTKSQLYFISDEAILRSPFINNHTSSSKGHICTLVKYVLPTVFIYIYTKPDNKPMLKISIKELYPLHWHCYVRSQLNMQDEHREEAKFKWLLVTRRIHQGWIKLLSIKLLSSLVKGQWRACVKTMLNTV